MTNEDSARYTLYGGGLTQAAAVEATLAELELSYDLIVIDTRKGEHRTPEYLARNPAGFVPTLVTPTGENLHESAAIMLWLADLHPDKGLAPTPSSAGRGRFLARLFYLSNDIQKHAKTFFYPHRVSTDPADAPRIKAQAMASGLERWQVYDRWLKEDGPYALGEVFSVADLYMAIWVAYGFVTVNDITAACPSVARSYEKIIERPRSGEFFTRVSAMMAERARDPASNPASDTGKFTMD